MSLTITTSRGVYVITPARLRRVLCALAGLGTVVRVSASRLAKALGLPSPRSAVPVLRAVLAEFEPIAATRKGYLLDAGEIRRRWCR